MGTNERGKRFWGFPINTTFTSLENMWREIKATRVHAVNRSDVEFALAVHIEPYPCAVLSVWVYLAVFVDKTTENLSIY